LAVTRFLAPAKPLARDLDIVRLLRNRFVDPETCVSTLCITSLQAVTKITLATIRGRAYGALTSLLIIPYVSYLLLRGAQVRTFYQAKFQVVVVGSLAPALFRHRRAPATMVSVTSAARVTSEIDVPSRDTLD
jgi:hypothetical protein